MSGYLRTIKTTAVEAVSAAFKVQYPAPDPQGGEQAPFVSVEYPVTEANYPAVWVDYAGSEVRTVGIAYTESDASGNPYTRWKFAGHVTFTLVALSSNERDLLYDQLLALTAYASQSQYPSVFRQVIEDNPLIASVWSFDSVEDLPPNQAPGTPWGTMDVIYERGFSVQVLGEFVTGPVAYQQGTALVPLSEIQVVADLNGFTDDSSVIDVTSNSS